MMRHLALLLGLSLAAPLAAQQAVISNVPQPVIQTPAESYRFPNGQTLHYDAEWRIWKAGEGTLRVDSFGEQQHVSATAEASGAVALLYRVQDRFDSFFDRRSGCSQRILKHSEEGIHKRETNLVIDSQHGRSILDERNLRNGESKHQESDVTPCATDVLSGIFYVSSQRLEPGTLLLFPLNDGGKTVSVKAYVEGREEIKTDAGLFRTVRVGVSSDAGPLKGRGKIWIWYTDDASHLPVQMRSRLFWGTMTLRLSRIDR